MALGSVGFYVALAFTLLLMFLVALIFKKKVRHPLAILGIVFMFLYWGMMIIFPNISHLSSPKTPEIHGRVTNSTGKPLAGVNVKAVWIIMNPGGFPKPYKVINMTTNEKGEFQFPKVYKALSSYIGYPFFGGFFEGIRIIAYTYDYKFYDFEFRYLPAGEPKEISELRNPMREYVIALQPFTSDKEYLENLEHLDSALDITNLPQFTLSRKEKEFVVWSHRNFEKKFPYSDRSLREHNLLRLSGTLGQYGNHREEISVLKDLSERFPSNADFAKKEIRRLKKFYNITSDDPSQGGNYAK